MSTFIMLFILNGDILDSQELHLRSMTECMNQVKFYKPYLADGSELHCVALDSEYQI